MQEWLKSLAYLSVFSFVTNNFSIFKRHDPAGFVDHPLIVCAENKGNIFFFIELFHHVEQVGCRF